MANNKIVYFGQTLIDLTGDTATAATVLSGSTFHDKSGAVVTGSCTYDSDTSDDTIAVAEMLDGKTAHARGALLTGTMPNIGSQTGTISTKNGSVAISQGYHDGSGSVSISSTERSKIIATNIKSGVTILGITGSYDGDSTESRQSNKNVTPSTSQQVITPDSGYTCLSQVTVAAISYTTAANSAGGTTVTIG